MSEEVIAALKLADRGGGHRDYADILAEAVRELAWAWSQGEFWPGEVIYTRWLAAHDIRDAIVKEMNENRGAADES